MSSTASSSGTGTEGYHRAAKDDTIIIHAVRRIPWDKATASWTLSAICSHPPTYARQHDHSFDGKAAPIVAQSGAHAVADAISNMLVARAELQVTQQNVPDYTGQWSDADYYRNEQATYDEACNDLLAALKGVL